jgi:hypothetical protein
MHRKGGSAGKKKQPGRAYCQRQLQAAFDRSALWALRAFFAVGLSRGREATVMLRVEL